MSELDLFTGGEQTIEIRGNGRIDWRKYKAKVDLRKISECKNCGEQIWWGKTRNGKNLPIEYSRERGGYISHYDNCG